MPESTAGYKPANITATEAKLQVGEIERLKTEGDREAAQRLCVQLYLDVLYTIASAPTSAYKSEMRRLAQFGLVAYQLMVRK